MRNILKGGLRSLIPKREVKDADEALEYLEAEEAGEEEVEEEEVESDEEVEDLAEEAGEEDSRLPGKRVSVVEEEEEGSEEVKEEEEPEAVEEEEDGGKEEVEEETKVEQEEEKLPVPKKPLVTPLTISKKIKLKKTAKETVVVSARKSKMEAGGKTSVVVSKKSKKAEVGVKESLGEATEKIAAKKPAEALWDRHEEDVQHVAIVDIKVNPNQPRRKFDPADMAELTSSIEQHGILQPLVLRRKGKSFELIAGERRLRAAKELGWDMVPCVVRKNVSSGASHLELSLIENIQREDLNPIEEAMAYRQLNEEYGMTHEEVGQRVGRSRVGITNTIRVLQLPAEIQQGLVDDKISSGHARAILMIPDDEKQIRFYRHLVEEGLTVRKAETRARRIQRAMDIDDPMRHKRKGKSAYEIKSSGLLEDRYGFNAKVKFDENMNRYEVLFKCHSKEEIDQLVDRLMGKEELAEGVDRDVIED